MSETKKRTFYLKKGDYIIKNLSLVKSYNVKFENSPKSVFINFNEVLIKPTSQNGNEYYFDFTEIRNNLRDIVPNSDEENNLYRLEDAFSYNSLLAYDYYTYLPNQVFHNSIFFDGNELRAFIVCDGYDKDIDIEEEYYESDRYRNK